MLFQYQGEAEPFPAGDGPAAWMQPPQMPVRRAVAAMAVALAFVPAPQPQPPFVSPALVPAPIVRQATTSTVGPIPVAPEGTYFPFPAPPRPLVRPGRAQYAPSSVKPVPPAASPVVDTIYVDLTPVGGCPGDENACVSLAVGPVLDQSLFVTVHNCGEGFAVGPVLDKALYVGASHS